MHTIRKNSVTDFISFINEERLVFGRINNPTFA